MWWTPSIFGAALVTATIAGAADPTTGRVAWMPALDVVLRGTEALGEARGAQLRDDATRIWAAAGIALRWPSHATGPRPYVTVQIDWKPAARAPSCASPVPLGSIIVVNGRPSPNTIVVSGSAASELVRCGRMSERTIAELPGALRDRLVARVLARVVAHEIGHYLLGPAHTDRGIMRERLTRTELVEPLPAGQQWVNQARTARRTP